MNERDERRSRATTEAESVLRDLVEAGAVLAVDGDQLRVRAPRGAMGTELRQRLGRHRDAVQTLMMTRFRGTDDCVLAGEGLAWPCRRMTPCARPLDGRPCLMEPVCCLCGHALPQGRRYLCPDCTAESEARARAARERNG
jgi:hypothetical protein